MDWGDEEKPPMAKGCRNPKNSDRILAKRSQRQYQTIRELQSADEQIRLLAVHKLRPCRAGNFELFELYLYPLRHDPSKLVPEAVNQAFNEGLERVYLRDQRAWREDLRKSPTEEGPHGVPRRHARVSHARTSQPKRR
jgi:hypothetical protein